MDRFVAIHTLQYMVIMNWRVCTLAILLVMRLCLAIGRAACFKGLFLLWGPQKVNHFFCEI